ncbi:head maturation protease, ClpP-related [Oceaniovalibus sp. ACAM 378]|uniref:head maturation protease, ClpP-related n=1 Tax=Oceaniovalibus sp. ACAM 378 TaxID=2599923 RepID=UPI0011D8E603|nr:head maturation protease, ClpP-related [Oceaniovalibus sp. ACAM 378]TYB83964.1 Clp protease ClpP [Oceaniovalibus sp. ACAM 378]
MENEIHLYGSVGGSFWDEEFFTPNTVRDELAGRTGPLSVRINSGGGFASDGQAIYTMLRDYPDRVDVVIDGIAASAASLIAMAGDTITMRLGATMMIHDPANPWVDGRGTEDDHLSAAAGLSVMSGAFAAVYAKRAGISRDAARAIMRAETHYDGDGAITAGFATAVDEGTDSTAVAAFDYRIYANASAALRSASTKAATPKSKPAILAMMAGSAAPKPKGRTMPPIAQDQREEMEEEEEDQTSTAADGEEEEDQITDADGDGEEEEEEGDETTAAAPVAVQIMDLCEATNRPTAEARDMIARGLTLNQAVAEITASRRKENPVNANRRGGPTARILRDERATRRIGMTAAISAQIMRADQVDAQTRPFMNLTLAEMAASCAGHTGPLRNSGQRMEAFMAASHSTSDFPAIFENALNKVLLERYQLAEPTYRQISRRRDFTDFRAHPQVRAGDFPTLQPVGENGEIKYGTFGESRETAILSSYAVALRISRQMMVNDELGAIDDVLSDYGQMVADFEEQTFYAFALSATLSDTKAVFHADHNNLAAAGAAISVATVSAGRAAIRKQKSIDGKAMNMSPSIILVGPDKETEAEQLVASIQPQEQGKVNPFAGRLEPVVTAQITGNAWYLLAGADRPGGALWVHGFLDGAAAPRIRMDEPFGQQGVAMSVEHDFGLGAIDHRGGWKNPGA